MYKYCFIIIIIIIQSENLILLYNDKKHIDSLNLNLINTTNGKPVVFVKIEDIINWYIRNKPKFNGISIVEMMKIVNVFNIYSLLLYLIDCKKYQEQRRTYIKGYE